MSSAPGRPAPLSAEQWERPKGGWRQALDVSELSEATFRAIMSADIPDTCAGFDHEART